MTDETKTDLPEDTTTDTPESGESVILEETREELAKMYLLFLDKQKGGVLATGANIGVNLNPLQKEAIQYMTSETTEEKTDIFAKIGKNIKKKLVEKFAGGTMLEYDKASLNKMRALIMENKNNKAKLDELMAQIAEGIDPTITTSETSTTKPSTKEISTASPDARINVEYQSPFDLPPEEITITSGFGLRTHPVTGEKNSQHNGIDISAPLGTAIRPIQAGTVIESKRDQLNGNMITIRSDDGRIFSYLHMKDASIYKVGDHVGMTDIIGYVGNTGRSTGPHLHLTEKIDNTFVDPLQDEKISKVFEEYKGYEKLAA